MSDFIQELFGGDQPSMDMTPTVHEYTFSEDTTKLVGVPLTTIYGDRVGLKGNVVYRKLSTDKKKVQEVVALCWGPIAIDLASIRINEKRPEYINDAINPDRSIDPGYIAGVKVTVHFGTNGQAPAHDLKYGLNRTAYLWVEATANQDLSSINDVYVVAGRGNLFVAGNGYNTPIPTPIASAFPSGIPSTNVVAAGLEYLLNTDYGAGRSVSAFGDCATWIDAINHCNGTVSLPDGKTEARYAICLEAGAAEGDMHSDVLEQILGIANATPFDANGVTKLWIAKPRTISAYLDTGTFMPQSAETTDIMDVPNLVSIQYKDTDDQTGDNREVVWEDKPSIAAWQEIRDDKEMRGIRSRTQASRMARFRGRRAKAERLSVKGIADQRFFNLEPGDLVGLTLGSVNQTWFSQKPFWVNTINPDNKDGDVELQLVEYGGDSLFDDQHATTMETNDPIISVDASLRLPKPTQRPLGPLTVTATVGVQDRRPTRLFYIDVEWVHPEQPDYMHNEWVIYRRTSLSDPWVAINSVSGQAQGYRDLMVTPHTTSYYYAVMARTSAGVLGVFPGTSDASTVAMSLDKPPAVDTASVALLVDRRAEVGWEYSAEPIDFEGYLVYAIQGHTWDINQATNISKGLLTAKFLRTDAMTAPGHWIVGVIAKDTFGNLSDPVLYDFDMPTPEDPTDFTISPTTEGLQVGWKSGSLAFSLAYELRDGLSWDTGQVINSGFTGTSAFVPVTDASQHTLMLRSVDFFGHYGANVLSLTASVARPDDVAMFEATAQGDHVNFVWGQVSGAGMVYEVRLGESWGSGTFINTSAGDNATVLLPYVGDLKFWIKAVSPLGLYSENAYFATTKRATTSNRNVIINNDLKAGGWSGVVRNMEVISGSLAITMQGAVPAPAGEYFAKINLGQNYHARNWLDYRAATIADTFITWDDATFTWDSEQAQSAWFPTGDADGTVVSAKIAINENLATNILDGWSFDGTLAGWRNHTPASSTNASTYASARYASGLVMASDTVVTYSLSIPSQFAIAFNQRFTTAPSGTTSFVKLIGAVHWLELSYDASTGHLKATDDTGNVVSMPMTIAANDIITFNVSQSSTTRVIRAAKINEAPVSASAELAPVGAFTSYRLAS